MATMKIFKVNALPGSLEANALYFVKVDTNKFTQYFTDSTGAVSYTATVNPNDIKFNRYTLPFGTSTTGVMDLSSRQIYKIDASTAGATIPMSFTNIPTSSESMVIVVEINGSTRQVTLPAGVKIADGVDNTLGVVASIMTFFFNGTNFTLMSNGRINA